MTTDADSAAASRVRAALPGRGLPRWHHWSAVYELFQAKRESFHRFVLRATGNTITLTIETLGPLAGLGKRLVGTKHTATPAAPMAHFVAAESAANR